ncbi:16S rRNA (uracil(1498)-N(3))-methyltransferase [Desulfolithobacter sp.]
MNILLFKDTETKGTRLCLTDRRAEHIRKILKLGPGDSLRLGMINGRRGTGRILSVDEQQVELEVCLDQDPLPEPAVILILALPRPIMVQRIFKQAATMGIRELHLIRSRRVEKSFFHSPVLQPEKIQALLVEGLEQATDTRLPRVHVHHYFKPFIEEVAPSLAGRKLLADPGAQQSLPEVFGTVHPPCSGDGSGGREGEKAATRAASSPVVLAIGPEGGWNEFEIGMFVRLGFNPFSMGPRILHVDTAVVALLAQISLLQDLNR